MPQMARQKGCKHAVHLPHRLGQEKVRRSKGAGGGIETIKKPLMVEYNKFMNGVDQNDQTIKYYGFPHRYSVKLTEEWLTLL